MIGIDCGGRKVAIVDVDNMFAHTIEVKQSDRGDELFKIASHLTQLELGDGPKWVEAPVLAGVRNIQSTIKVAQVTGVVHASLSQTHTVPVSSWKKRVVGSGSADKDAVRNWLREFHPGLSALCGSNQDLVDAACIGLYGRAVSEVLEASGLSGLRGPTGSE